MATLTSILVGKPTIAPVFDGAGNMTDMVATFMLNWVDEKGVPQMTSTSSMSVWDSLSDDQKKAAQDIRVAVIGAIKAKV